MIRSPSYIIEERTVADIGDLDKVIQIRIELPLIRIDDMMSIWSAYKNLKQKIHGRNQACDINIYREASIYPL